MPSADRLYVITTPGLLHTVNLETRTLLPTPFLDLVDEKQGGGEGGVLGLALHPDFENNSKFYVYLTVPNDNPTSPFSSQIREYTVSANPDIANTTYREILTWEQPSNIHNGGWIGFNPEVTPGQPQYLYIGSGDGGSRSNAQNTAEGNLFGKILRIDVDGDDFPSDDGRNYAIPAGNPFATGGGAGEIWSYGLRNPWRSSFDSETGDLWIGDVGNARVEEVNFQPSDSQGGRITAGRGSKALSRSTAVNRSPATPCRCTSSCTTTSRPTPISPATP